MKFVRLWFITCSMKVKARKNLLDGFHSTLLFLLILAHTTFYYSALLYLINQSMLEMRSTYQTK